MVLDPMTKVNVAQVPQKGPRGSMFWESIVKIGNDVEGNMIVCVKDRCWEANQIICSQDVRGFRLHRSFDSAEPLT